MMRTTLFIFAFLFGTLVHAQSVLDKVDLFISTSGDHGQLDPAATVPFGMIKLGPDTDPGNHSGYNFEANKIRGFSHNRIGGVGCSGAGGNLRILPGTGDFLVEANDFHKSAEKASPAYYSATFNNQVKAELTATNNTGYHRYTFPESEEAYISFDLESSFARFVGATKNMVGKQEFTASISAMNVCNRGRYTVHYYVHCSTEPQRVSEESGRLVFHFNTGSNEVIELQVTTSVISQEDAQQEWEATANQLSFDQALEQGQAQWEDLLSRIEVDGKQEYETLFYTHLYHTLLNPVKTENRNKQFKATNGEIHTSEGYVHYDSWSMWDNFRNKFSLYSLILPDISRDICHSLVDLYQYGKAFWSSYHEPVPTVRTEHTIITLLDFYSRGIQDFDVEKAYYNFGAEIGNISSNTPDTQLEKAYDYWALSEFARLLDKPADQVFFHKKAMEYKKTWMKYFAKIDDQSDIMHAKGLYEGTIWQYRWHVQYDIEGLISLFDGIENYTNDLEYFYTNELYNHGNQPDIHVPFMFNYSSKPWLTQKWVNEILTKEVNQHYGTHDKWDEPYHGRIYKADPVGYIPEMDDDEGTMSGWYVLSSMGMYPLEVGKPLFQLSSPIFNQIKINLGQGRYFEIETKNLSEDNFYIKRITLNGKEYNSLSISQADIMKGGTLVFELSPDPNKALGRN